MVPLPRLKANKLFSSIELDSSHQSNLFLKLCSTSLHKAEDSAIRRKDILEWALGIGMTLNSVQDEGIICFLINLLIIKSKRSVAVSGRYFNMSDEMLSKPEVIDLRESITEIYSPRIRGRFRQ